MLFPTTFLYYMYSVCISCLIPRLLSATFHTCFQTHLKTLQFLTECHTVIKNLTVGLACEQNYMYVLSSEDIHLFLQWSEPWYAAGVVEISGVLWVYFPVYARVQGREIQGAVEECQTSWQVNWELHVEVGLNMYVVLTHTCTHMHACMHARTCAHTHTHTHTRTHTHTHIQRRILSRDNRKTLQG